MRMSRIASLALLGALGLLVGCASAPTADSWPPSRASGSSFALYSSAFGEGQPISRKYATEEAGGSNVSPPLEWSDPPPDVRSFAVEVIDLNPVARGWVHWLVADIPPDVLSLEEGASTNLPKLAMQLENGFGGIGWGGPQPPAGSGTHEYRFVVVALDTPGLGLSADADVNAFRRAVTEHAIDSATLTGTYER